MEGDVSSNHGGQLISWIFGILFSLIGLGVGLLYFHQERLVFFPEILPSDFQFTFEQSFEEKNLSLSSGETVNYLIFNPSSQKGSILYFHGNGGSLRGWGEVAAELARQSGFSVWMMDFPGYGKSAGPIPKTEQILIKFGQALRTQIELKNPQLPLVIFGRSLGTGIASKLAKIKKPAGLILETPYRSIAKLGHEMFPILPEFFSRFDLDNERDIAEMDTPAILILHGTADSVIPFSHGKLISQLQPEIVFVEFPGGLHSNLSQFPEYWPAVLKFLRSVEEF